MTAGHNEKGKKQQSFDYNALKDYARFLLDHKLTEFVQEQIDHSFKLHLPVLQYFSGMPSEKLMEMSLKSNREFLQSILDNTLEKLIEDRFQAWVTNQIPMLNRDQLVSEDLTLGSYIRKKAFSSFIKYYTKDVEKAMQIMDDVDKYVLHSESRSIKFFINLQQEKINEQLQVAMQNEELYKKAEALTHLGNWTWDILKNKVTWSDEMYSMYGLEPQSEEITFERFKSFVHPDEREKVSAMISNSIAQNLPIDMVHRALLTNGAIKYVHVKGKMIQDENGKVVQIHGTRQDVTEQKIIENQLIENQTFVQKIANVTPSIIAAYNVHSGQYIFINNSIQQLLGYEASTIMEQGVGFFMELIHPDDLAMLLHKNNKALEEANATEGTGDKELVVEFTYRMRHKNGTYKWFHTYGTIFDRNPGKKVEHVINISVDISEEYRLRAKWEEEKNFAELLIETSPYMILTYDKEFKVTAWNKRSEEITGIQKIAIIGKHIFDVFPDYDTASWREQYAGVLKGERLHFPQIKFMHDKGWGETFVVPLKNKQNEVIGILSITNDITTQVKSNALLAEKNTELQKQKDFVETILDASVDVICVIDQDHRYLSWNKKAELTYGLKREAVIGKTIQELFPGIEESQAYKDLLAGLQGSTIHNMQIKSAVLDQYFENFIIPLRDENDAVYGVVSIAHDNSKLLKNTELLEGTNEALALKIEQLRRSEERFHKMTEEVQDYAILLLDEQGYIENWNKGAEKIKGYKPEEIIGKNFRVFYTKSDQETKLPEKLIQLAIKNGKANHQGWRIRKDGTTFWGNIVLTALHDDKKGIIGFSKVTHDLTEKKMAEDNFKKYAEELEEKNIALNLSNEKLILARKQLADDRMRYLIEQMPHIVATAKPDGTLEYANKILTDYTGITFSTAKNNNWFNAIHPDDIERLLTEWRHAFTTGEDLNTELRLRRSDAKYLWHLAIAKPLKSEDDAIFLWLITLTNIDDQKMLAENKDQFIGVASHELKTPLTSAKAYMQLVQLMIESKDHPDEESIAYVRKANVFINKLNMLISELLDITKIQHDKLHLNISAFNLIEMINENIEFIQASSSKHIIPQLTGPELIINADKERIQQVLFNLLSNAIKYSPDANIVNVFVKTEGRNVIVSVQDYGIGIPKMDLEKIFERFYRVENNSTKFQGLGIGLFISAEIIKRHNGMIWAESDQTKGTVFSFSLPIYKQL